MESKLDKLIDACNNEHVYCINCKHFILECDFNCEECYCEECFCGNFEDSKSFLDRPYYESKTGLTSEKKAGLKQIMGKYSGKASLSIIKK